MEFTQGPFVVREPDFLLATIVAPTDAVDCLNAKQVAWYLSGVLESGIESEGIFYTTATDPSLVDQSEVGHFHAGLVGMDVTGPGIDTNTKVLTVTDAHNIVLDKPTTASAIDVEGIAFSYGSIALASLKVQVARGTVGDITYTMADVADALCVQKSGGDGTTGLVEGNCVVILTPKNAALIPWPKARLVVTGHATKSVPGMQVKCVVSYSGATPVFGGLVRSMEF